MGENSNIEWTHHTFNPWRGCTKVSEGCRNCYAAVNMSVKLHGVKWGPNGTRVVKSESGWREPLKWNRDAEAAGERRRVFCASLADVFEGPETMPAEAVADIEAARARLFNLIYETKHLDWLLLTKRPENANKFIGGESGAGLAAFPELYPNVWIGTSVENQETANKRIPELMKLPAVVRFLSMEPLIGPVDLTWVGSEATHYDYHKFNSLTGEAFAGETQQTIWDSIHPIGTDPINWVIVGGESGTGARPFNVEWARSIVSQCKAAGVPAFVKQFGARPTNDCGNLPTIRDRKGGDMAEWPADLRVRDFPAFTVVK